jgi:hypothetical protein
VGVHAHSRCIQDTGSHRTAVRAQIAPILRHRRSPSPSRCVATRAYSSIGRRAPWAGSLAGDLNRESIATRPWVWRPQLRSGHLDRTLDQSFDWALVGNGGANSLRVVRWCDSQAARFLSGYFPPPPARSLRILIGTSLDDRVRIRSDRAELRVPSQLPAMVAGPECSCSASLQVYGSPEIVGDSQRRVSGYYGAAPQYSSPACPLVTHMSPSGHAMALLHWPHESHVS